MTVYSENRYKPEDSTTEHIFNLTTPFRVFEVDGDIFKRTIDQKSLRNESLNSREESKSKGVGVSNIDRYKVLVW